MLKLLKYPDHLLTFSRHNYKPQASRLQHFFSKILYPYQKEN